MPRDERLGRRVFWQGFLARHWRRLDGLLPAVVLISAWYFLTRMGVVDPVFLPSPGRTLSSFFSLLTSDFLFSQLLPSLERVGGAFLICVVVALPLGLLSGQIPWLSRMIQPICGFTRYLPVAALVPLCILWFGIDDGQKIAVITIGVVFQLTLVFAADAGSVPKELIEAARTFGLSRMQVIRRIVLPWSMPAIWDDLRIAAGWAWSYLVLSELVAGNRGIGYFVVQAQRYLETDKVFAGILFIGILGALTDLAFRLSARRLFQWA
jgi:NitT/TauT family transport system permease protein